MTDDNTSAEPPAEPVVAVAVAAPAPEPDPDPAPVVVPVTVIDGGDGGDAVDATVLDHTIDNAVAVADLQRQNAELAAALEVALATATTASETANAAVEIAADAHEQIAEVEAGEQAPADDDHTPTHEHPWFRTHHGAR